jgi:hypothetical protein
MGSDMRFKGKVMFVIIIGVIAVIAALWMKRFMAIDKCLDAGGRWNYEKGLCEKRSAMSSLKLWVVVSSFDFAAVRLRSG